jgi:RES domain.
MGEILCDEVLEKLHKEDKIATKTYKLGTQFKRCQPQRYDSGIHYGKPTEAEAGRFNDPTSNIGVCYVAEYAITALGETYGRQNQREKELGQNYTISRSSLEKACMCTLRAKRDLVIVDLGKLMAMLHITIDQVSSPDYSVTHQLVAYLANKTSFDGISFRSRHFDHGYCIALFERNDEQLEDVSMDSMSSYADSEYLPQGWEEEDIDVEEMLTDLLNIAVF